MTPGRQFQQLPMFLAPHEISAMNSNDFKGSTMSQVPAQMRKAAAKEKKAGYAYRELGDQEFFNADTYLNNFEKHVSSHGGIEEPIHADAESNAIVDGQHRAVIGMRSNRLVPVQWHPNLSSARQAAWGWN